MIKKIANISVWVLLLSGIIVLVGFVDRTQNTMVGQELMIDIDTDEGLFFVEEVDIAERINDQGDSIIHQPLVSINTEKVERLVTTMPAVEEAEVYKTIDGVVKVKAKQRRPIVRIINQHMVDTSVTNNDTEAASCYIDDKGQLMPLSDKFSARVLLVTGSLNEPLTSNITIAQIEDSDSLQQALLLDDIYKLAQYIDGHEFWKKQIQHVHVNSRGEFEFIPRVGNHRVMFGKVEQVREKFNKLMIFYKKGLSNTGWNRYDTISLKYKNQIVCNKR